MKVLVLVRGFPSASETFIRDHVLCLARCGHEVLVAPIAFHPNRIPELISDEGLPDNVKVEALFDNRTGVLRATARRFTRLLSLVSTLCFNPRFWDRREAALPLSLVTSIRRVIDSFAPDVLHAHFGPLGVAASLAIGKSGLPFVVNFHGFDVTSLPSKRGWSTYARAFDRTDKNCIAVVHSGFVDRLARENLHMARAKVTLGVETKLFACDPRERASRISTSRIRFLFVGRLVAVKGVDVLLDAFARLQPAAGQKTTLTIVGSGAERSALVARSKALGIDRRVAFVGEKSTLDVAEHMRAHDVLVVPSQALKSGCQEAFGRVVIEGMAAGMAVVATPTGGLADTVGDAGLVAAGPGARDLAGALEAVLDVHVRKRLMARALTRATDFTSERMCLEYQDAMNKLLAQGLGRDN